MFKVYHNPRCKKSRAGLQYLESKTSEIEIVNYIKTGIIKNEIENILKLSGLKVIEIVRKQEDYYKKEMKNKDLKDEEIIEHITKNPKLLQRPFILTSNMAVLGDPVENIDKIL